MEDAVVEHALQLEVGAQGGRVDGEALAAHPLGVEGAVPRGDGVARGGGELVGLRAGVGGGDRGEAVQHRVDRLGGRGGRCLDDPRGVVGVAEQAGPLGAELDDLQEGRAGVVLAAEAPGDGRGV